MTYQFAHIGDYYLHQAEAGPLPAPPGAAASAASFYRGASLDGEPNDRWLRNAEEAVRRYRAGLGRNPRQFF